MDVERAPARGQHGPASCRVGPSFDTVFYPGGHGPLWDLAEDRTSIGLIESSLAAAKPVALVCHAPGVLRHVRTPDGKPLVEGKKVTGFANTEEEAVGLTKVVPFLVEDELKAKGGLYSRGPDWAPYVVRVGRKGPDRALRHQGSRLSGTEPRSQGRPSS